MRLPNCPDCDEHRLERIRAHQKGYVWAFCGWCKRTALVSPGGVVVHQGMKDLGAHQVLNLR